MPEIKFEPIFFGLGVWMMPGVMLSIFRSFALKGTFPALSRDDLGAALIGSMAYYVVLSWIGGAPTLDLDSLKMTNIDVVSALAVLFLVPALLGFALGASEAADLPGQALRRLGINQPAPHPTAFETLFRALPARTFMIVTLNDGTKVYGRWVGGKVASSASTDQSIRDLYLSEIGTLDAQGRYVPHLPKRGAYLPDGSFTRIEVI